MINFELKILIPFLKTDRQKIYSYDRKISNRRIKNKLHLKETAIVTIERFKMTLEVLKFFSFSTLPLLNF